MRRERLQRPSAPPPPPPPPPQSASQPTDFGLPQLTSTPTPRLPIGFERLENFSTNTSTLNVRLKPVKNPLYFDWIILAATLTLFLVCILAISMFQTRANQFYLRFMNISSRKNSTNVSVIENTEYMEAAAGSDLVKQTILVCNGPWFSYQMNNLLMLPFSLILSILFSLLKRKDRKNSSRYLR